VAALKDVSAQLGPIGAAIQTKLASTTDEPLREVLAQQKSLAVGLYDKLSAFLGFEQDIRGPLKKCLRELASLAGVGGCGVYEYCLCTVQMCLYFGM
jgi:hypothetical protein